MKNNKSERKSLTLLCMLISLQFCFQTASAQLSDQSKADLLQQQILKSISNGDVIRSDEYFQEYEALDVEMPTTLKLHRASVSAELGEFIESKKYLEDVIEHSARDSEVYKQAILLYPSIEAKAEAQSKEIRIAKEGQLRKLTQKQIFKKKGGANLLPKMLSIPGGRFTMGSNYSDDEKPIHEVQIRSFLISKYEVSQALWMAIMGENPSKFRGENRPVDSVSWNNVQEFIRRLNEATGKHYRLPSESEWEYAARAGSTGKYSWGDAASEDRANYNNSNGQTMVLGSYKENQFGINDMHGNVWEWVQDCYHSSYLNAPTNQASRSECDSDYRVLRGGSWFHSEEGLRVAYRYGDAPAYRFNTFGFRLAEDDESN